MDVFYPFIHMPKKKKEDELQPLYVELDTPQPIPKEEEPQETKVIIIELL